MGIRAQGRKNRLVTRRVSSASRTRTNEEGFTLIELLIVVTILPLIIGALSAGLIAVFSLQSGVPNRLGDTADSQVVEANFQSDVQGAASLTTAPLNNSAQCGPGTQLLGLAWGPVSGQSYPYQDVVSYVVVQAGSSYNLVRQFCSSGYSSPLDRDLSSSTIVSYDVPSNLSSPVATIASGAPSGTSPSTSWVSTQYVTGVAFPISEPSSNFSYTLDAVPAASWVSPQRESPSFPLQRPGATSRHLGPATTRRRFASSTSLH